MKKTITLAACAAALLCGAGSVSAQTVIRLTGSTAYRGATHTAITNILSPGYTFAYTGASLTGAGQAIFTGSSGVNPVIIKTSWSGSVGGVQTVVRGLPVVFLPTATPQSTGGTGSTPAATAANGGESLPPDICLSDTYQSSTLFTSPVLTDRIVGVVPFKFVASEGSPAALANITPQLAQALWGSGTLPLALFSGLGTDHGTLVYATGRDPDSGTRLTAFAETGVGVNSLVTQYKPAITAGAVTGHTPYPAQTINGISYPAGQGGEGSGGTLAGNMGALTTAATGFSITYLSTGDAAAAITAGARELTYNGVPYSPAALFEGSYTFWGYAHLMYRTTLGGVQKSVADALAARITISDATVKISEMQVSRTSDGGPVLPNY